jgi:hypothetical protein
MPNKQSSRKRNTRRANQLASVQTAPIWATGASGTERKFYFANQITNANLFHNTPYTFANSADLFSAIAQGTGVQNRIGNRIKVLSVTFTMVLNTKADRPNVSYRICTFAAPATASTDEYTEHVNGGTFFGQVIPSVSKCYHDQFISANQASQTVGTKERSVVHTYTINLNRGVQYSVTSGLCSTRLVTYVIAYDSHGTLITDNIASVAGGSLVINFTDE